jgi:hypothetical protein
MLRKPHIFTEAPEMTVVELSPLLPLGPRSASLTVAQLPLYLVRLQRQLLLLVFHLLLSLLLLALVALPRHMW